MFSGWPRLYTGKGRRSSLVEMAVTDVGEAVIFPQGVKKSHCKCRVLDFVFSKPCSCHAVRFFNRRTYSISMLYQSSDCSDWKIALWDCHIMPTPHVLGRGSENCVTLLAGTFLHKMEKLARLRLIMKQPSPHWDEFGVSNFTILSSCGSGEHLLAKASNLQKELSERFICYEVDLMKV